MARATFGGRIRIGGGRRPCRRLLPVLLGLAMLVPVPAAADSSADLWMSARQAHARHQAAIGEAVKDLADGGTRREVQAVRSTVAGAVRAIDALEVHACFQVWWSYIRSSFVLFDQALVGFETNDPVRAQSAVSAARFLTAMAARTAVDCPRDDAVAPSALSVVGPDGRPLATSRDSILG